MEPEALLKSVNKSINELDGWRSNRTTELGTTGDLLEYLIRILQLDRNKGLEKGRIKQPTSRLLEVMSERNKIKLKNHLDALSRRAAGDLEKYATFVKKADGKQVTRRLVEQADDLPDFLKQLGGFLENRK
jgi:hypothetical protein